MALGASWRGRSSQAHRFFAAAAWSADAVGLAALRLAAGWLIPAGAPVVIAVDDTMFRRAGRKVHAAHRAVRIIHEFRSLGLPVLMRADGLPCPLTLPPAAPGRLVIRHECRVHAAGTT